MFKKQLIARKRQPVVSVSKIAPLSVTLRVNVTDLGSLAEGQLAELSTALDAIERLRFVQEVLLDVSGVRYYGAQFVGIIAARTAKWEREGKYLTISSDRLGLFSISNLESLAKPTAKQKAPALKTPALAAAEADDAMIVQGSCQMIA